MEREFHRWIKQQSALQRSTAQTANGSSAVLIGIGDDAAVLDFSQGAGADGHSGRIVLTTDAIAEGTHFDLAKHSLRLVGRKSLAVNLSDLAAMGATPVAALLTLMIPRHFTLDDVKEIFIGCQTLAAEFDVEIVGGDTNSWDGPLLVSVTAIGKTRSPRRETSADLSKDSEFAPVQLPETTPVSTSDVQYVETDETVWRLDTARSGDAIVVSGSFGGSIHGQHLAFQPRVALAQYLITNYQINAATDASDSLSLDLSAMATASSGGEGLGVEVNALAIPISDAARQDAGETTTLGNRQVNSDRDVEAPAEAWHQQSFRREPQPPENRGASFLPLSLGRALTDGEDFELILAMDDSVWESLKNDPQLPCRLTRIGHFVKQTGFRLVFPDGRLEEFEPSGYSH
jgi:thiamine-monophosphate kinase